LWKERNLRNPPADEEALRPASRVVPRPPRGLPKSPPAPAPAGLGGVDHRHLGVQRRDRRLRVPPGRRFGRRARRANPVAACGVRGTVHVRPRRPLPARAGDARLRSHSRRRARRDGRDRPRGWTGRSRLRALGARRRRLDGLPAGAGRAAALTRPYAGGADRGERELEHARKPRLLRRPGPRRRAAHGLEHLGRLRRHRLDLPLVGIDAERAPAPRRASAHLGAASARPRGGGRLPRDR